MKIAAVLPAYNEETRVGNVLKAVLKAPSIHEVIVVNDGSTDSTADVVRSVPGVRLIDLPLNIGKGGAMTTGAEATDADILVFLDADLIGLKPEHVEALVSPLKNRSIQMAVGRFKGGRKLTDWSQRLVPIISGQRAIKRQIFEQIPNLEHARYGVEMAITKFCLHFGVRSVSVLMAGVTHPLKEEKLGFLRGMMTRTRMYAQIFRILLDIREPRRIRPRKRSLIRTFAANQRLRGRYKRASDWLVRQERTWRKRRIKARTRREY